MASESRDWFRSSCWDPEIALAFEARLKRARPENRTGYIGAQGYQLTIQDDPELREVGRSMLRRAASEPWKYEFARLSNLERLGIALLQDGYSDEAEPILRQVIDLMKTLPTGRSGTTNLTELSLAEVLLARGDQDSLDGAQDLLDDVEPHVLRMAFFRNAYLRYLVCRARVAALRGDRLAGSYASEALQVSAETEPSIPRHPDLGRPHASDGLRRELEEIVSQFPP